MDYRDIGIRAAKTALQAFLAVLIPALTVQGISKIQSVLVAAAIAALAAFLSVVQNALTAALRR